MSKLHGRETPDSKPEDPEQSHQEMSGGSEADVDALYSEILTSIYLGFFIGGDQGDMEIDEFLKSRGLTSHQVQNTLEKLRDYDLILHHAGPWYRPSPRAVALVEENHLVDSAIVADVQKKRRRILETCFNARDSSMRVAPMPQLQEHSDLSENQLWHAVLHLQDCGYLELPAAQMASITLVGVEYYENLLQENNIRNRFADVETIESPQKRGIEFEKVMRDLLIFQGLKTEHDVRGPHEQHDLIIWDDWHYVVIECKWEKKPIDPDPVNKLFSRLESRPGARGAVMSMTGFNAGAEDVVLEKMSRIPIMLYGEKDIRGLFAGEISFEDLQRSKWETLIKKRKVLWA